MSRYIDADLIHKQYDKYANHTLGGRGHGKALARFLQLIDEQPTADVVPKERYDRLLESAIILSDALREYQEDAEMKGVEE